MRVLTFLERLDPLGGRERVHLDVCRGLAARGHAVELRYRYDGADRAAWEALGPVRPLPEDGVKVLRRRPLRTGVAVARATAGSWRVHPDAVLVPARLLLVPGALAATASGAGLVAHLHDQPRPLDAQDRWAAGRVDRFLAVSAAQAAGWAGVGVDGTRIDVVPNGVDLDRFRPATDAERADARRAAGVSGDGTFVVASVGRITEGKGLAVLVDALAMPAVAGQPVELVVAGGAATDDDRRFEASLRSRQDVAVRWLGAVDDPAPVYRAADVVVVPSVAPDAFPTVVLEALAAGVPVVASDLGGLPETIGLLDPTLLVPPGDAAALRAAVARLAGDAGRRAGLAAAARRLAVDRFGVDAMVDRVEQALLVSTRPRRRSAAPPVVGTGR